MKKKCSKCGEEKRDIEFYKDKSKKYGLSSHCKECVKSTSRQNYKDNTEKIKEKQKIYRKTHSGQIKQQKHRWSENNKEHVRRKKKQWALENKDRCRENFKNWCEINKEYWSKYQKQYYDNNKEKLSSYIKMWKRNNPQYSINYRIKRLSLIDGEITKNDWRDLMIQYDFKCFYCEERLLKHNRTLDHIIPVSKGGKHNIENLIPCCRRCNSSKNSKIYPVCEEIRKLTRDKKIHLINKIKSNDYDLEDVNKLLKVCEGELDDNC